eukprot:TRINITY_DN1861_c0_g1_i4.p1 TRINITY_DN1861_c0_g1~~TRINITY_DN1861_c0_g1_i4.p1  ORF type:complete len:295 (-),score=47.63 TRINITY_DN1861_c0_g1_i4:152-1036(-)
MDCAVRSIVLLAILILFWRLDTNNKSTSDITPLNEIPSRLSNESPSILLPQNETVRSWTYIRRSFYLRGSWDLEQEPQQTLTLLTHFSLKTLPAIIKTLVLWNAPAMAAVYIYDEKEIEKLHKIYQQNQLLRKWVDIHLVFANGTGYPINVLRNEAIFQSRTEFVLMLDPDFLPSPDLSLKLKEAVQQEFSFRERRLRSGEVIGVVEWWKKVLVVAAFEYQVPPAIHPFLPSTKSELLHTLHNSIFCPFDPKDCQGCYSPTNYLQYSSTLEPYTIKYQWMYAPHFVVSCHKLPP